MLAWTKLANRTLILSPFAARFDQVRLESRVCRQSCAMAFRDLSAAEFTSCDCCQYNDPSSVLAESTGVELVLAPSNSYGARWILWADNACYNPQNSWWCATINATTAPANDKFSRQLPAVNITAWGVWGALGGEHKPGSATLATYSDGNAAMVASPLGLGRVVHCGFWPGLSWWFSNVSTGPGALSQPPKPPWAASDSLKEVMLSLLPPEARGPVQVSLPLVEAPLLVTPDETGAILTLLDWRRTAKECESPCVVPAETASVEVSLPFVVEQVHAVETDGELKLLQFEKLEVDGRRVRFSVELQYARVVKLLAVV